jgi:hypothetical protein
MDNDNRIEQNFQPYIERRERSRNKVEPKTREISHEKLLQNRTVKNRCIQRGIRLAAFRCWREVRRGLVYRTTTPSHDIPTLIQSLPTTVKTDISDEDGNTITVPFDLQQWKYLDDRVKPYIYQLALSEHETASNHEYRLVPFVFNESAALSEAIHGQKRGRVEFIIDHLGRGLKSALRRPVAFWFVFETARRGQPHYQGSILLRQDEHEKVKRAFHRLNRKETPREKGGAIRLGLADRERLFGRRGQLYTDLNWADYSLKERSMTRREFADHTGCVRTVAASRLMRRYAHDYYDRLKAEFDGGKVEHGKPNNPLFGSW